MRRFFFALLATAAVAPMPSLAADFVANSRITMVTVYPDRATVTREASVDLPAGASTVVFEGLPANVFTDSLRAEGEASAAVTLGALENKLVSAAELAAPRERELTAKLVALQDQRALVEADQAANQARQQFISSLGSQAGLRANENIAAIDLKPEQWQGAANSIYGSLHEALKAADAQRVALRSLDDQINATQTELNQLQTGQRSTLRVAIPLEAAAATRLVVKVSYQLSGATWRPLYDARLETAASTVSLTQFGEVQQQTGEDWADVALTLSTAQPARGAELPQLTTAWLDLYNPQAAYELNSYSRAGSAAPAMMMDSVAETDAVLGKSVAAPAPIAAAFQQATIETGGYVSEYRIAGKANVLADGSARKVMVGQLQTSATLLAQVRPAQSASAFLVARTKLEGETPLLPGQANLFRDGAFIGSARLAMLRPGEETTLSFGIDDQIVVKRQVLEDKRGEDGLITKDTTLERRVVTKVQNLHKFAVKAEVLEAVPVARNEQIKVKVLEGDTTAGFTKDADNTTGLYRWPMDLAAGAKAEVKLGWQVSWPKDSQISGMP